MQRAMAEISLTDDTGHRYEWGDLSTGGGRGRDRQEWHGDVLAALDPARKPVWVEFRPAGAGAPARVALPPPAQVPVGRADRHLGHRGDPSGARRRRAGHHHVRVAGGAATSSSSGPTTTTSCSLTRSASSGDPRPAAGWSWSTSTRAACAGLVASRWRTACYASGATTPGSTSASPPRSDPAPSRANGSLPTRRASATTMLPPLLFEHPAAELSVDDSAQLCEDRRQPGHIA